MAGRTMAPSSSPAWLTYIDAHGLRRVRPHTPLLRVLLDPRGSRPAKELFGHFWNRRGKNKTPDRRGDKSGPGESLFPPSHAGLLRVHWNFVAVTFIGGNSDVMCANIFVRFHVHPSLPHGARFLLHPHPRRFTLAVRSSPEKFIACTAGKSNFRSVVEI